MSPEEQKYIKDYIARMNEAINNPQNFQTDNLIYEFQKRFPDTHSQADEMSLFTKDTLKVTLKDGKQMIFMHTEDADDEIFALMSMSYYLQHIFKPSHYMHNKKFDMPLLDNIFKFNIQIDKDFKDSGVTDINCESIKAEGTDDES